MSVDGLRESGEQPRGVDGEAEIGAEHVAVLDEVRSDGLRGLFWRRVIGRPSFMLQRQEQQATDGERSSESDGRERGESVEESLEAELGEERGEMQEKETGLVLQQSVGLRAAADEGVVLEDCFERGL